MMPQKFTRLLTAFAGTLLAGTSLAGAAEVTQQRLLNPEPQNWLMNHRTYDGQRFSPLARISKDNVKNLRLAYAVPLGGGANEWLEATSLVEDGFLYISDAWGVLYKIDVRLGDVGRIVWRMEPKQERPATNRGAAMWGNYVISVGSSLPTRRPARWSGRPTWFSDSRSSFSQPRRCRSRTRSSSAPPAATAACATGLQGSTRRPDGSCGASSPFPRPASPAARPGRAIPTPGKRAVAPCG